MVHGNAINGAPEDVCSLQTIHELHDVSRAAGCLPIKELFRSHGGILTYASRKASAFSGKRSSHSRNYAVSSAAQTGRLTGAIL